MVASSHAEHSRRPVKEPEESMQAGTARHGGKEGKEVSQGRGARHANGQVDKVDKKARA